MAELQALRRVFVRAAGLAVGRLSVASCSGHRQDTCIDEPKVVMPQGPLLRPLLPPLSLELWLYPLSVLLLTDLPVLVLSPGTQGPFAWTVIPDTRSFTEQEHIPICPSFQMS